MNFNYYYNNVPGVGLTRNNLIYTSLISQDKKTFVKWYFNDTEYHSGQNEVVDLSKMEEKWEREVTFLKEMSVRFPMHVPKVLDIDYTQKKIYLEIDGLDFWNRAGCLIENYDSVLPDWKEQMVEIIEAHKEMGWHKYSMHPSSYFVVEGKLKSINYFFTYRRDEPNISIKEVESHIHSNRQAEMRKHLESLGIEWDKPQAWNVMDRLCWESFRTNYPSEFIKSVKECIR
jgi:hypothetical protein